MELRLFGAADESPQILFPIVYETRENYLDIETIVRTAKGVEETFLGTSIALYGSPDHIELIFGGADSGSVKQWIGKKARQGALIGSAFAAQQFTDGFLETATGKTFRDWGATAAEYSKDLPSTVYEAIQKQLIEAELCRKLLEAEEDEVDSILAERPDAASAVQKGRRIFYESCRANEQIPSVRFGLAPSSPRIVRSKFSERTKRLSIGRTVSAIPLAGKWRTAILTIEVTSPNWDRLDQQRGWKGTLRDGKHIYFHISDSAFWRQVLEGTLETKTPDIIVAQIIYEDVNGRYKNADAIRILKFNGYDISAEISKEVVVSRLQDYQNAGFQIENYLFETDD